VDAVAVDVALSDADTVRTIVRDLLDGVGRRFTEVVRNELDGDKAKLLEIDAERFGLSVGVSECVRVRSISSVSDKDGVGESPSVGLRDPAALMVGVRLSDGEPEMDSVRDWVVGTEVDLDTVSAKDTVWLLERGDDIDFEALGGLVRLSDADAVTLNTFDKDSVALIEERKDCECVTVDDTDSDCVGDAEGAWVLVNDVERVRNIEPDNVSVRDRFTVADTEGMLEMVSEPVRQADPECDFDAFRVNVADSISEWVTVAVAFGEMDSDTVWDSCFVVLTLRLDDARSLVVPLMESDRDAEAETLTVTLPEMVCV